MIYIFNSGAIMASLSGRIVPENGGDVFLYPKVADEVASLKRRNHAVALLGRFGGVAHGIQREQDVWDVLLTTNALLNDNVDFMRTICMSNTGRFRDWYSHERGDDFLLTVRNWFLYKKWDAKITVVGLSFRDEQDAEIVKMPFQWAHEFFDWPTGWVKETRFGYVVVDTWLEAFRTSIIKREGDTRCPIPV